MATKKADLHGPVTDPGRPLVQAPDEDLDLSDIPEVTDFSKAVRGKYYEQATGRPRPPAVRRLNTVEAENRRLREALRQIANMADAEEPLSVKAGAIAREALEPTRNAVSG
jgi:hypothetical protein